MLKHDAANRADGGPGHVDATNRARIERLISDTNPAQLTREITAIQDELELLSRRRTEDMARRAGLDMGYLGKAIERMRADARQDNKLGTQAPFRAHFQRRTNNGFALTYL